VQESPRNMKIASATRQPIPIFFAVEFPLGLAI
jgi:hypothetical protein